jgi:hypothetical protein
LIQARAQPQASETARIAATPPQSRPAEPGVQPFAAQALRSAGEETQPQPAQTAPVLAGAAISPPETQPTAATQPEPKKPVETHGIHNVVSSGKGDMLAAPPTAQPQQPPAAAQYSYGQAPTAGSGAAFR